MQTAETVLNVLRDRGRRDLPCNELYRQLFNPSLYLLAYGRLYSNQGAMTPGTTGETADGMSMVKIGRVIDALRHERFRFEPAKLIYIPKKNGKARPLGLPSWTDKLVGEVIRLLLEAYYEPRFSDRSHGFRPRRGCHTALSEVAETWSGTTWFIEGDISDCFGSLDHRTMLAILGEKIHDNRFLRLIKQMLQAGYLEDWVWNATLSGAPQGGVVSPILANIYMDRLDKFVETVLIPEYTRGKRRTNNPAYFKMAQAMWRARKRGDRTVVRELWKQQRGLPCRDPHDPGYRRLRYVRYADDHLLGFAGPKAEAEEIKARLAAFLRDDLKLELNEDKTVITHGRTKAAMFLGYEITVQHSRDRPTVNGTIGLRVPRLVIKTKCAPYLKRGKPERRPELMNHDDLMIISRYGAEYRGLIQYYIMAGDVWRLSRLEWVAKTSMLKTLAAKHGSTVSKMARKYKATIETPHGPRTCFQASLERPGRKSRVARFGGIPLKRQKKAVLVDRRPALATRRNELISRLQAGQCEWCERKTTVEVHQVPKLADLTQPGRSQPAWAQLMARMRRKTLVVCTTCHQAIHAQQPIATSTE
ncbi:reverse transcriptase domain-containing protein [Streptomyces sp. NPDC020802]|uniref:reverse transcriptase domain-containing protein n=1 Tax=Streptomyces sp. NPDC020802 TaxID=3365094 RepID=UPI0037B50703